MGKLVFQKAGMLIDAENIEISGYGTYGGRTDYKKILSAAGHLREITRIIYYKPLHKEISEEFKKFWSEFGGEIKQPVKSADSYITIDAVTLADKLDVLIILGGDKDYLPLLWYLKSRGCKAEVWGYPETVSDIMIQQADAFFPLDETFIIPDKPTGGSRKRG
ncbi:MAG: NYN domain-containing protein [Nitrospinota bacterium]